MSDHGSPPRPNCRSCGGSGFDRSDEANGFHCECTFRKSEAPIDPRPICIRCGAVSVDVVEHDPKTGGDRRRLGCKSCDAIEETATPGLYAPKRGARFYRRQRREALLTGQPLPERERRPRGERQ